ncbi:MAG: protein phosphatase 2C domain-containing protein [Lachnospiraceae bacterium]|nr:protein phosphatase 2C domain-containing protein [Lachnospiraceae bacterium]
MFGGLFQKNDFDIFSYTNVGGREINEDACCVFKKKGKGVCVVVADGLGGHGGGAVASRAAVTTISECFLNDNLNEAEDFMDWYVKANDAVRSMQNRECEMKTTMVTLMLKNNKAFWAHLGDSRLYHFVDDRLVEQTVDHSVSQMAVIRGDITPEEIRGHEDRNRLLSALGRESKVKPDFSATVRLDKGMHSFLLCTDGFWEYVLEKEMEKTLKRSEDAREWMGLMVDILKKRAKPNNDNNTAIAVNAW